MRRLAPLALLALALAAAGCGGTRTVTKTVTAPAPTAAAPRGAATFAQIPGVVERVSPSIVTIFARTPQGESEGSGVIWSRDGVVVTNNHVVAGATELQVVLASGTRLAGRLKARDPLSDLAVVTVDRHDLPAATFARSLPRVGQLAIAIGSPLGFQGTVTAGIISGLHRSLPATGQAGQALVDLMQTDAPISPGNSGGALVDAAGEIVGVNVAYIPPAARAVAIGFAIPSPTVRDVVEQLVAKGRASHAFLGIQPADITPDLARQFRLGVSSGVLVQDVVTGSAAEAAGLRQGDVITKLGSSRIAAVDDLLAALRRLDPGETVRLEIVRDGKTRTVEVTLRGRSAG